MTDIKSLLQRLESALVDIPAHVHGLMGEVMDHLRGVEHVAVTDGPEVVQVAEEAAHQVAETATEVEHEVEPVASKVASDVAAATETQTG